MNMLYTRFEAQNCSVCNKKISRLGARRLEDGYLCKDCAAKLSPWFSDRRKSTVNEISRQLEYREANRKRAAALHISRSFGDRTKLLADEINRRFIVTADENWEETNPDVISFSDVVNCDLDIGESRTEIEYRDDEGNRKSFDPRCYAYGYNFYIVLQIRNPYFDLIRFRLNADVVDGGAVTLVETVCPVTRSARQPAEPYAAGNKHTSDHKSVFMRPEVPESNAEQVKCSEEYKKYETAGLEIRKMLTGR